MITYELSKQLKEAGFPNSEDWVDEQDCFQDDVGYAGRVVPTLSELIEACGDGMSSLAICGSTYKSSKAPRDENGERPFGGYEAISSNDEENGWEYGRTPEEAVARLWLALNKKSPN